MKRAYPDYLLDASLILEELPHLECQPFLEKADLVQKKKDLQARLYQPPFWIRVALYVATWLGGAFCMGWVGLLFFGVMYDLFFNELATLVCCLIAATASFVVCRHFIRTKNHYGSGVDDALAHACLFCLGGAAFMLREILHLPPLQWYSLILASGAAAWFSAYFLDRFMALISLGLLLYGLYELVLITPPGMLILPFVYFATGLMLWLVNRKWRQIENLYYDTLLDFVEVCSLVLMTLSIQYVVVREAFHELMHAQGPLPFAAVFQVFSVGVPAIILYLGWKNKNRAMLWVGYLGIAFAIFTLSVAQFHLAPEAVLVFLGGASAVLGYWLYKQLKANRFQGLNLDDKATAHFLQDAISQVIQTSVATDRPEAKDHPRFGEGKFGGGGASSDF